MFNARWLPFWSKRSNRYKLLLSIAALAAAIVILTSTMARIESRPGAVLPDPLLAAIPSVDLTEWIFVLIYGSALLGLWELAAQPEQLVVMLRAYALLMVLRSLTLWLTPLEPPPGMIVLRDPVVQVFLRDSEPPTKDLFFSGHVSATILFSLASRRRWVKSVLVGTASVMGVLLAVQHVHYAIDLIVAPFFAVVCYRTVLRIRPPTADA